MLIVTPFYTALLVLFYIALSFNVIRYRFTFKQSLGTGGEKKLQKMIRMHGNFSEYVPLIIIMMAFFELAGGSRLSLHLFGLAILVGRCSHAYGLAIKKTPNPFRIIGMATTFGCLIGLAIRLIVLSLQNGL